jgi:surface protein
MPYKPATNEELADAVYDYLSRRNLEIYGNIGDWDVSDITNMDGLFAYSQFNEDISRWDVSNVTNMMAMFFNANEFNQPLNSWNVSNVTDMTEMFKFASNFNQPLNSWNVSNVTDMTEMFKFASNFNQSLDDWNVQPTTSITDIFVGCPITYLSPWFARRATPDELRQFELIEAHQGMEPQGMEPQGIAYQVHNAFVNLDMNKLMEIIKPITQQPDNVYTSKSWNDFLKNMKTKMANTIKTTTNETISANRKLYTTSLNRVFKKITSPTEYSRDMNFRIIIGNSFDYAYKQPQIFIGNYVNIFIEENVTAYGSILSVTSAVSADDMSCVKGVLERFTLALKPTLTLACSVPENCKPEYSKLLDEVFYEKLNLTKISQEWDNEHLSNDSFLEQHNLNEGNPNRLPEAERIEFLKNDFVEFVKAKLREEGVNITPRVEKEIQKTLIDYNYVFRQMYFGGRKRYTKKRVNKIKISKRRITKRYIKKKRASKKNLSKRPFIR